MFKPAVLKKMKAYVKKHVAAQLITNEILPEYPELDKLLFAPQQFHVTDQHSLAAPTPFGVPEVRYLVEGTYNILGWPVAAVEGDTLAEKISAVNGDETAKKYVDMAIAAQEGAFFFVHAEPGTACVLPSGYIILTTGAWSVNKENQSGALGLRWGAMGDTEEVLSTIKEMTTMTQASYGKVSDDYDMWVNILKTLDNAKVAELQDASGE